MMWRYLGAFPLPYYTAETFLLSSFEIKLEIGSLEIFFHGPIF